MKDLIDWIKLHPFKAVGFSSWFTFLATTIGGLDKLEPTLVGLFISQLVILCLVLWKDIFDAKTKGRCKINLVLTLCLSLGLGLGGYNKVSARELEQEVPEPAAPLIIGVTVVVVGGIVYYLLNRTCQRVFNRPPRRNTNAEPQELTMVAASYGGSSGGDADYAACWSYFPPWSCDIELEPASVGAPKLPIIALELIARGAETPDLLHLDYKKLAVTENLVDGIEFNELLKEHGVEIGRVVGEKVFGKNGIRCEEPEVPIRFSIDNGIATVNVVKNELEPSIRYFIERSGDMREWITLTAITMSRSQEVRLFDASVGGSMFYRLRERND